MYKSSSFIGTDLLSPSVMRSQQFSSLKHPLEGLGSNMLTRSLAHFDFNSFVFSREIRAKIKSLATECKEKMELLKLRYYEANNQVDLAIQPLIDRIVESRKAIIMRNEETYQSIKKQTTLMLDYLRDVYRELREEEEDCEVKVQLLECGTSSEEMRPNRFPETKVDEILDQVKDIVKSHNEWSGRMERHFIREAGVESSALQFFGQLQTVDSVLEKIARQIIEDDKIRERKIFELTKSNKAELNKMPEEHKNRDGEVKQQLILGQQANTIYKGMNDVIVVQTKFGQLGLVKHDRERDGYIVRKTVNIFPEQKDNYLFNAFYKGEKYYLSYISQFTPYLIVMDQKGEILYRMNLGKKWVCAFADYSNRFLIAAGYHSLRMIDTQAVPPEKSPIIAKEHTLKCGQVFGIKKTYKTNEYMLMTKDGLHFVDIERVATAPRVTFDMGKLDLARSIMKGKEIREAIEYERESYILCAYDDKNVHFATRNAKGEAVIQSVLNPSGGEYYRNLMKVSGYHAIRMPYVFLRDDKGISLINTTERQITFIVKSPFDYWAPLTMEVTNLSDPAGAPLEVIIHCLEQSRNSPTVLKFFKYNVPKKRLY